ncbi:flavin-containing monooxygenase [Kytococcus sp. Marseille-QA3725]
MSDSAPLDVLVIGGGQSGLATAHHLERRGLSHLVLEAAEHARGSWPLHYRSLRLFSPAKHSSLPGMPFPGDPEHYPVREEAETYIEAYAARFADRLVVNSPVEDVRREDGLFRITVAGGREYTARSVIVASGAFRIPFVPEVPGREEFTGTVLHSLDYQVPEPFAGQRVVVVGSRNSAVQIGVELARIADVTLAVRRPVQLLHERFLGRPVHDWFTWLGIDQFNQARWGGVPPDVRVLDDGRHRAALRAGKPPQRPVFETFTTDGVRWPDGTTEPVDTVLFATGFRSSVGFLSLPGAVDESGAPRHRMGVSTTVPGLYFVGLPGQLSRRSATLRGAGRDARHVVRHLQRWLRRSGRCRGRRRSAR